MSSVIDPSIPLSGNTQGLDVGKMLEITDVAQQMRQRQTEIQSKNALSQLLANQQSYDADGNLTPVAQRNANALNPQFGLEWKKQSIEEKLRIAQENAYKDDHSKIVFDTGAKIAGVARNAYDEAIKTGATPQMARDAAIKARNEAATESGPILGRDHVNAIVGGPFDPDGAKAYASLDKDWISGRREESAEEHRITADKIAQERADTAAKGETDRFAALMRGLSDREKGIGNPKVAAFDQFMKEHPNATAAEQANFIQTSGAAPRSPMAMATQRYIQEHPDATAEDLEKFYSGMRAQAASTVGWDSPTSRGGQQIQALNTATNHLETLRKLGDALKNGNVETFNAVAQTWAQETGNPAPTNWDSAMRIVGGEVVKSVVPGGGGVSERAAAEFKRKLTPAQISGAVDTVEELMRGQATSARTQYTQTTKRDAEEFYKRFDPPAQKVLFGRSSGGKTSKSEVKAVSSKAEYDRLPKGAQYSKPGDPPGSYRTKQ